MIPKKGKSPVLKIVHRYHFSPALKRMSVVAGYNVPGASETHYMATVKGAPETLKNMVSEMTPVCDFFNPSTRFSSSWLYSITFHRNSPNVFQLSSVPENYDSTYLSLSRRGARVLALGYRKLPGTLSSQDLRELTREKLESNLTFAGFVIISCPLKPDSKAVIKEIVNSSHSVRVRGCAPYYSRDRNVI